MSGELVLQWRGPFTNEEIHRLHAGAFETRLYDAREWDWEAQVERHSLGWVVGRIDGRFVAFVNVLWDGLVHAFIEDVMVDVAARGSGVGVAIVQAARAGAAAAGCEHLHVNFEPELAPFYLEACGFEPVQGGLIEL